MQAENFESEQSKRDSSVLRGPRTIPDGSFGEVMTVVERRSDVASGAGASSCLVFSTDRGFIRLWKYPAHWMELTDAELRVLSEFRRADSA